MKMSQMGTVAGVIVLAAMSLGIGSAHADELYTPEPLPLTITPGTLTVSASTVEVGGTITVSGTSCLGIRSELVPGAVEGTLIGQWVLEPGQVVLTMGDYVIPLQTADDGTWSYSLPIGMRLGFQNDIVLQDGTIDYDLFASPPGSYAVTATCDNYNNGFDYPASSFTVVDPDPAQLTVVPPSVTASMLTDPTRGVEVAASSFTPRSVVDVTVTYPDGTVATLNQETVGDDGTVNIPLYYDGANPPLGAYTVTVSNYYESAKATFTVVAEAAGAKTKNSQDLAATGVKLDVPLVLSTGGLLVLAGAGALVFARRREISGA